jgi:hypothetical protein
MRGQEEAPRRIDALRPEVPAALAGLVARMLERDPSRRPGGAADVVREFDALARPPRPTVSRGRRRFLAGLAAAAAVGAGAAVWFALPRRRPDPEPPNEDTASPPPKAEPPGDERELASPDLIASWKKDLRDRSLAWLKERVRFGPDSDLAAESARDVARCLDRGDGAQVFFGDRLMKSGRPALLAVRLGGVFPFDLSADHLAALQMKPNTRRVQGCAGGEEGRRARPRVVLSGLRVDDADALPRDRRITGRVSYAGLGPGERPHVRLTHYAYPVKKRVTGYWYLRQVRDAATVEFDFGPLGDARAQRGPTVLYVEVACWDGGREVIESNTLAVLVTPKDDG